MTFRLQLDVAPVHLRFFGQINMYCTCAKTAA